jgi:hypothetical protein
VVLISFVVFVGLVNRLAVLVAHVRLRAGVRVAVVRSSFNADHCEDGGAYSQADCGVEAIERFRRLSASPF